MREYEWLSRNPEPEVQIEPSPSFSVVNTPKHTFQKDLSIYLRVHIDNIADILEVPFISDTLGKLECTLYCPSSVGGKFMWK
jgi:hypothetical protein